VTEEDNNEEIMAELNTSSMNSGDKESTSWCRSGRAFQGGRGVRKRRENGEMAQGETKKL